MYKLEELSIADLKAVFDYANERVKFYQDLNSDEVSRMTSSQTILIAEYFEFYLDVSNKLEALLDERIKQIFKP